MDHSPCRHNSRIYTHTPVGLHDKSVSPTVLCIGNACNHNTRVHDDGATMSHRDTKAGRPWMRCMRLPSMPNSTIKSRMQHQQAFDIKSGITTCLTCVGPLPSGSLALASALSTSSSPFRDSDGNRPTGLAARRLHRARRASDRPQRWLLVRAKRALEHVGAPRAQTMAAC